MHRILLADDDILLCDTVKQMLELDGHHVTTAHDGQEALSLLKSSQGQRAFDLIISDMLMPLMDGAQFIAMAKQEAPAVPVIAISGGRRTLSPQFSLGTAEIVGAVECLRKPFDRPRLQTAIESALSL